MTCKTSFKFLETLTFKFSCSMVSVLYVEYLPFGLSTNINRKYSNIFGEILKKIPDISLLFILVGFEKLCEAVEIRVLEFLNLNIFSFMNC